MVKTKIRCKNLRLKCQVVGHDELGKTIQILLGKLNEKMPDEHVWNKRYVKTFKRLFSVRRFEDISNYRHMYENFFHMKEKIERGQKVFDLKEPLLNQIMRTKVYLKYDSTKWMSDWELEMMDKEKFSEGQVVVAPSEYNRIKNEVLTKGKSIIYDKYGFESYGYMKDGELYDSDGDRKVLPPEDGFKKGYKITNPIMKKFWTMCSERGFDENTTLELWSEVAHISTKKLSGLSEEDIEKLEFETISLPPLETISEEEKN